MSKLGNLLVHLFGRNSDSGRAYLSSVYDRCLLCDEAISETTDFQTYRVCPYCRFHYTLSARERIELLADRRSFRESQKYLRSVAPISFSQRGSYRNLLSQNQNRTGLTEATVTGTCRIGGIRTMLVVLDFGFMGGSMGSVVGEKIALAMEHAARNDLPLVALVTGGGARVQEGVLSLMQMAKTVTAANRFKQKNLPFIVALANPSTGQAYASFANLADVILAEPGSLIGFSPLRTLRAASGSHLPQDAHTAEAHLQHGLLDSVVDRESLKPRLVVLLKLLTAQKLPREEISPLARNRTRPGLDLNPKAWESVTATRQEERPTAAFYLRTMLEPFVELHGDRLRSDDRSIVGGIGYLRGEPVVVIGQQRPYSLDGARYHVCPDGLRKAQRLIRLAVRFGLPLITLIDTQGADPGLQAEEQGIGNAIATTLSMMAEAPVPVVSAIIGEGGSEGALALGVSDRMVMQQYAIYSPISLNRTWSGGHSDSELDRDLVDDLMLTARECLELRIIDALVPEPAGGAHTNAQEAASFLQSSLMRQLGAAAKLSRGKLLDARYKKFRQMGENTAYSQEAMDREVELLSRISATPRRARARAANARKRVSKTVSETPAEPLKVDRN